MAKNSADKARSDWNPALYARFHGLRLRPALDLLGQVGDLPKGHVIDLGCGAGAVGPALCARFLDRKLIGIDKSPAMLAEAAATGAYRRCDLADATEWEPKKPAALIFSNALLQWLPEHAQLLPRLAGFLAPGGMLAVQMPRQYMAPSHRLLRKFAQEMFPDRFDFTAWQPPVGEPAEYMRLLAPLGEASVWQTDYIQKLAPQQGAHPVRRFTESTAMRPFAEKLTPAELAELIKRYETALAVAYPAELDGSVLFPFRRVFLTVKVA